MALTQKKYSFSRIVLLLVVLLLIGGYVLWRGSTGWGIDQQVARVEKTLSSYNHVNVRVPLGEVDVYRDGTSLIKVSARFFGEYARRRIDTRKADYYVINNTPVYLKERVMRVTSVGDEVRDIEENRYYFTNGKLQQWWRDDEKRQETDAARITKREQELTAQWKALSDVLAPRLAWTIVDPVPFASFLPGKVFMNFCMSGEYGIFKPDGSVPITIGHDFTSEDTRPSSAIGSWRVEGETLTITGTTLSDATYRDFIFEKKGDIVIAYPEVGGCGLYVGPNSDILYEFTNTELVTSPGVDW